MDGWMDVAFWVVSHMTEESRTNDYFDYALARAEAWWSETREPGRVWEERCCEWFVLLKGEGWEICTTSPVRRLHGGVSKHIRRANMLLSPKIPVKTVCRTLQINMS
jgi:hypothetical protein